MTLREAKEELKKACDHIFNVEKAMALGSETRRIGYRARLAVADFDNNIRSQINGNPDRVIDDL